MLVADFITKWHAADLTRGRRAIEKVPRLDCAGRSAAEIMTLTLRSE